MSKILTRETRNGLVMQRAKPTQYVQVNEKQGLKLESKGSPAIGGGSSAALRLAPGCSVTDFAGHNCWQLHSGRLSAQPPCRGQSHLSAPIHLL